MLGIKSKHFSFVEILDFIVRLTNFSIGKDGVFHKKVEIVLDKLLKTSINERVTCLDDNSFDC